MSIRVLKEAVDLSSQGLNVIIFAAGPQIDPIRASLLMLRARASFALKDFAQTVEDLKRCQWITCMPRVDFIALIDFLVKFGLLDLAKSVLGRQALNKKTTDRYSEMIAEGLKNREKIQHLVNIASFESSQARLVDLLKVSSMCPRLLTLMAECRINLGQVDLAREALGLVTEPALDAEVMWRLSYVRGLVLLEDGNLEDALPLLKAGALHIKNIRVKIETIKNMIDSKISARKAAEDDLFDKAEYHYRMGIEAGKEYKFYVLLMRKEKLDLLTKNDKKDEALEELAILKKLDPTSYAYWEKTGDIFMESKKYEEAENEFRKAFDMSGGVGLSSKIRKASYFASGGSGDGYYEQYGSNGGRNRFGGGNRFGDGGGNRYGGGGGNRFGGGGGGWRNARGPRLSAPPDHYGALNVERTADTATIRQSYISLARTLHPDKTSNLDPAERAEKETKMKMVTAAYDCLSTWASRREHDDKQAAFERQEAEVDDDEDTDEWEDEYDDYDLLAAFMNQFFGGGRRRGW